MSFPELSKRTVAAVELVPLLALDGRDMVVVIIKRRFGFATAGRVHPLSDAEIRLVDVPWDGDDPASSVKWPSDVCLRKPATDVVVVGEACEKGHAPVKELDVLVRLGPVQKALRVFGPRVFYKGATGLALSAPEPFRSVPLKWELAYGGTDTADPKRGVREPRNPVGRGVASDPRSLLHKPALQIEDPRALWGQASPVPAGVAALPPHFAPRSGFTGTYNDRWERERMPLPPLDFDERHNQVATPDLICPGFLKGGERMELLNMSPLGVLHCTLPRLAFGVLASRDSGREEYGVVLDTVVVDTSVPAVELVWRTAIPQGVLRRCVRGISVYDKRVL